MKKNFLPFAMCAVFLSVSANASAQRDARQADKKVISNDSLEVKKAKGSERNVMLNASDATKPREIQIGLPSEDVNVYENGLPAVYSSAVHKLQYHWRSDASLGEVGLMTPSESAIRTGNIAYSVDSSSKLGQKEFKGILNYKANHFGLQQFDLNVSGGIGNNWLYSGSVYQTFDPGTFDVKFDEYADRMQIYRAGLTRFFNNRKGKASLMYKYAYSRNSGNELNAAPFIYVGDGSIKEIPGFEPGLASYGPTSGEIEYLDIMDGKMKKANLRDLEDNRSHEVTFLTDYTFDSGLKWNLDMKYMTAPEANYVDFGGSTISELTESDGYTLSDGTPYAGLVEGRRTWLHFGKVKNFLVTSELAQRFGNHQMRLGLNEWYYHLDYHSSSFQWTGSVQEYPEILTAPDGSRFRGFNELSPEYTKGYENKLALYLTDDWQVSPKLNIYYGARLEYYRMSADQIAHSRYSGFYIGDTAPDGEVITPAKVTKDKLNYAATARVTYNVTKQFGLTADGTVATRYPRINEYAGTGPTEEQYKRVTIPLVRGGLFYKNDWLDLTSMVTYIAKTNNIDQQNLTKPGTSEGKTVLLIYDIQTLGWTTSAEIDPFKGFHLHALFTYQKPVYKNYSASVTFNDGTQMGVNANNMIVKEIPQTLIELDPSYNITKDLRLWLSFRYFGKTYANLQEALYFNGRWETFGGVNWAVNKHLDLGVTVVNFLNQKGAKGTISGSELITKDEASQYAGCYMSGSYLRPFTVEFSASLKF
ncbi:fructan beta-(2 6)-fructosidase [Phocaeicola coprophilus CAG:333]|uniref:TonB-dependent receptor n=1 Tax=Phocaeicola coprophilus TaxID=387090 RepID=UPI0003410D20|nr:TonB-dependent receptor [Phocaeicola coprophilus]CDC53824.1 fructan beta-(2 6)-fructosidase [Phocaeicola coprophilus CAG:333]